jgi:hypothetical protein
MEGASAARRAPALRRVEEFVTPGTVQLIALVSRRRLVMLEERPDPVADLLLGLLDRSGVLLWLGDQLIHTFTF